MGTDFEGLAIFLEILDKNKTMDIKKLFPLLAVVCLLASCNAPKKIRYFQDAVQGSLDTIKVDAEIRIRPDDKLSIIVHSKDFQLMTLFNLPYVSNRIGQNSENVRQSMNQGLNGYKVSKDGTIDFPVLGRITVAGLTREGLRDFLANELRSRNLVNDAVVTVDFMNLTISVLGEVSRPGRYTIDRDKYTLIDALSAAGDLTIHGVRQSVKVMRTAGDVKQTYIVNLNDAAGTIASPVYYLQQGDVIYVEPNETRSRQSNVNGNNLLSASFWVSMASLISTVTLNAINLARK